MYAILVALVLALGPIGAASAFAEVTIQRGISLYEPFMNASRANLKYFNRTFSDPNILVQKGALADLRGAGFDTVRLPINPRPLLEQDGDQLSASIEEIAQGIELILSFGLTVVVDFHTGAGGNPWQNVGLTQTLDGPNTMRYLSVIERLSSRFARYDRSKIVFEPFNEPPCRNSGRPDWTKFMQLIYSRVRRTAPEMTIVITGACWSNWDGLVQIDPSNYDKNTLFTFHFYDPHIFTHQGTANTGDAAHYISRLRYPPLPADGEKFLRMLGEGLNSSALTDTEKDYVRTQGTSYLTRYFDGQVGPSAMAKRVDAVASWADRNNVTRSRVFVGEFGVTKDMKGITAADPSDRAQWFEDARKTFETAGFGWIVWNYQYQGGVIINDDWGPLDPTILRALGMRDHRR